MGSVAGLGGGTGPGSGVGLGTAARLGGGVGHGLARVKTQWEMWLVALDLGVAESDGTMGFVMPSDPLWPTALDDPSDTRPLGPWFRGDGKVLARMGTAVVGLRDSSPYGVKIAIDVVCEPTGSDVNVISGGAFDIDVAARRGALAADGHAVTVSTCSIDRYYPASRIDLYLEIPWHGGTICSEAPPGAAPHRHRFFPHNQIITALSQAVVVVEVPSRFGVISAAHHAVSIGRPIGAFLGPVTSPGSSGCYRLLRKGAAYAMWIREALELTGMEAKPDGQPGPEEPPTLGGLQTERQLALDALDPSASRVCGALPVSCGAFAEKVAAMARVSTTEVLIGLGRFERQGIAVRNVGLWKLARRGR